MFLKNFLNNAVMLYFMNQVCNSCKKKIVNNVGSVSFPCPQCNKTVIVRCSHCRKTAVKYTCYECNFRGPN